MPSSSARHRARTSQAQTQNQINPVIYDRHRRKCKVCRHRDRQAIETDFVEWRHPNRISDDYDVSYDALYRHAQATGLLQRRSENVSIIVQKLLEEVEYVEAPSAFAILRAVRTLACLNSRGQWNEPPTTHIIATQPLGNNSAERNQDACATDSLSQNAPSAPASGPSDSASGLTYQNSNRNAYEKLDLDLTDTKQTPEAISNRKNL